MMDNVTKEKLLIKRLNRQMIALMANILSGFHRKVLAFKHCHSTQRLSFCFDLILKLTYKTNTNLMNVFSAKKYYKVLTMDNVTKEKLTHPEKLFV